MRYSKEEKLRLMELIEKSGLPIKRACKQFGISDASYYTWRKQLDLKESPSDQIFTKKQKAKQRPRRCFWLSKKSTHIMG